MLIADRRTLVGSFPAIPDFTEPIAVGDNTTASVQAVLIENRFGVGLTVALVGSNNLDGTYVDIAGGSTTVSAVGAIGTFRIGSIPFAYIRAKMTAADGVYVYTLNANLTQS